MYREADGPWEMRKAVREQIRDGADYLKIMATGARSVEREDPEPAQMTREEVAAVVDEAHRMGFRVAAHAEGLGGARIAIEEGVDTIEHGLSLHRAPELLARMAERGIVLVPTLSTFHDLADRFADDFAPRLVDQAKRQAEDAQRTLVAARAAGRHPGDGLRQRTARCERQRAGPHGRGRPRGRRGDPRRDRRLRDGARAGRRRGTIEAGRAADLVVVDGDPLADPAILLDPARIAFVFKDGRIVAGEGAGQPPEPDA